MSRPILVGAYLAFALFAVGVHAQSAIALTKPTVLILIATPAEIKKHKDDHEFNEFSGDFGVYANRMVVALKRHPQLTVRWSSASTVTFPGTTVKPIHRRKLETEWGYVLFRPGTEPTIIEGVATDDQLVCTAAKIFQFKARDYDCGI